MAAPVEEGSHGVESCPEAVIALAGEAAAHGKESDHAEDHGKARARADPVPVGGDEEGHAQASRIAPRISATSPCQRKPAGFFWPASWARMRPAVSASRTPAVCQRFTEILREVERVLERKLSTLASEDYTSAGGIDSVVAILNNADRSTERNIIEALEENDRILPKRSKRRCSCSRMSFPSTTGLFRK